MDTLAFRARHYGGQKTHEKLKKKIRCYGSQLAAITDYFAQNVSWNMFVFSSFLNANFRVSNEHHARGNLKMFYGWGFF